MRKNLPLLGGFMIGVGTLEAMVGLLFAFAMFIMVVMGLLMQAEIVPPSPDDPPGVFMACCGTAIYGPFFLINFGLGATRLYAGILHLSERGAMFGWVSCVLGFVLTMCGGCGVFSAGISAFQLVMYLQDDVREALAAGDLGLQDGSR